MKKAMHLLVLTISTFISAGVARADLGDGLMAHYPFSGDATDHSGHGNDGAVTGATLVPDRDGNPNSAYYFDGNDRIVVPHDASLNFVGTMSISLWMRADTIPAGDRMLIGKSNYTSTTNFLIRTRNGGDVRWEYGPYHDASGAIQPAVWHHLVVTADAPSSLGEVFVDGVAQAINTSSTSGSLGTVGNPMTIGFASYGAEFFVGSIDDVRVYDRVLLASEVQELFSGAPAASTYCFGDPGVGTPCPCSNDNDGSVPGSGCANGSFASGARLTASGTASVAADSFVLTTTGLHPHNTGLYFQANNRVNNGDGNVFGDGLRCAGGGLIRLEVRTSDGAGMSATTVAIGATGGVAPGDTKRYQCWYRDTSGNQPCGVGVNDFNLSNGYEITWLP